MTTAEVIALVSLFMSILSLLINLIVLWVIYEDEWRFM